MANILKKWVESDNRELKRLTKIADKVEAYAQDMAELSDDELKAKTLNSKNVTKRAKRLTISCQKRLR